MNIFQSSSHLTHQWNFPLLTNSCCSWFSWLTQPYIFLLFLILLFFWTPFQVSSSSNLSCKELVALWGPALGALFHSHFARALKDLTAPVASSPILKRRLPHLRGDSHTSPLCCGLLICCPSPYLPKSSQRYCKPQMSRSKCSLVFPKHGPPPATLSVLYLMSQRLRRYFQQLSLLAFHIQVISLSFSNLLTIQIVSSPGTGMAYRSIQ